jgi:hypothetical protein
MSVARKGRCYNTKEHLLALAAAKRGVPRSVEVRAKISSANKGRPGTFRGPHSAATRRLISEHRSGKVKGAEHPQYRSDISTAVILQGLELGVTKAQLARDLGVSKAFINRRLKSLCSRESIVRDVR